jgi:hypothetical protein
MQKIVYEKILQGQSSSIVPAELLLFCFNIKMAIVVYLTQNKGT